MYDMQTATLYLLCIQPEEHDYITDFKLSENFGDSLTFVSIWNARLSEFNCKY